MKQIKRYIIFFSVVLLLAGLLLAMGRPDVVSAVKQSQIVIVIDAGHGGFDGGAVGRLTKVKESGLNLAVAQKLKSLCQKAGYRVIMTREDDSALGSTKAADMAMRKNIIEESGADMVVSIHMNKYPDSAVAGPQVFYFVESEEGKLLASCIQQAFNDELMPKRPRVHKPERYFILRSGTAPCVIAECGFLSNEDEERLLQTDDYQQKCANAIFEGVRQYIIQINSDISAEIAD